MQAWILDESPGEYRFGTIDAAEVGTDEVAVRPVFARLVTGASTFRHLPMMAIDPAPARICDLPATYRGQDVDHGRGADRGRQVGRLAIDEDVDVRP